MKLYHGSPKKLNILKPMKAHGLSEFENQEAIFLVDDFNHAARYAISKSLKVKAVFGVGEKNLVIFGNFKPTAGYVYEVEVEAEEGERGQYSYFKEIENFKIAKVFPEDYADEIFYVNSEEELMEVLR